MTLSNSLALVIFGIFLGTLISLGYLVFKKYKSRQIFEEKVRSVNEPLISNKSIVKKIMLYSIPFILIDISKGLYNYVDINTVLPGLVNYANFSVDDALEISGILSICSFKFNICEHIQIISFLFGSLCIILYIQSSKIYADFP